MRKRFSGRLTPHLGHLCPSESRTPRTRRVHWTPVWGDESAVLKGGMRHMFESGIHSLQEVMKLKEGQKFVAYLSCHQSLLFLHKSLTNRFDHAPLWLSEKSTHKLGQRSLLWWYRLTTGWPSWRTLCTVMSALKVWTSSARIGWTRRPVQNEIEEW